MMNTPPSAEQWGQLFQFGSRWSKRFGRRQRPVSRQIYPPEPPPLDLPLPSDCSANLITHMDLPPTIAQSVVVKFEQFVERQRTAHVTKYESMCRDYISKSTQSAADLDILKTAATAMERTFSDFVASLRDELSEAYQKMRASTADKRVPFHQEYTPLLLVYFEYNPYPTPRDRDWLARKSMMSPRQINVWFQNRRRRERENGVKIERVPLALLPQLHSVDWLEERLSPLILEIQQGNVKRNPSLPTPPPEPSKSQPSRPEEHMPLVVEPTEPRPTYSISFLNPPKNTSLPDVFHFPQVIWDRQPTALPPLSTWTVDELSDALALTLRIWELPGSNEAIQEQPTFQRSSSRFVDLTASPHPALVNPSHPMGFTRQYPTIKRATPRKPSKKSLPGDRASSMLRLASTSSFSSLSSLELLETPETSPLSSNGTLPLVHEIDNIDDEADASYNFDTWIENIPSFYSSAKPLGWTMSHKARWHSHAFLKNTMKPAQDHLTFPLPGLNTSSHSHSERNVPSQVVQNHLLSTSPVTDPLYQDHSNLAMTQMPQVTSTLDPLPQTFDSPCILDSWLESITAPSTNMQFPPPLDIRWDPILSPDFEFELGTYSHVSLPDICTLPQAKDEASRSLARIHPYSCSNKFPRTSHTPSPTSDILGTQSKVFQGPRRTRSRSQNRQTYDRSCPLYSHQIEAAPPLHHLSPFRHQ